MNYNIVTFEDNTVLNEIGNNLCCFLKHLYPQSQVTHGNAVNSSFVNILVGYDGQHVLKRGRAKHCKQNIFWNTEQPAHFSDRVRAFTKQHCTKIIGFYESSPNLFYFPLMKNLAPNHIPWENRTNHCTFLGAINDFRSNTIKNLQQRGLKVVSGPGFWGVEKSKLLENTKFVINTHYYRESQQEIPRIMDGIVHGCVIISERSLNTQFDAFLSTYSGVQFTALDNICDEVVKMNNDEKTKLLVEPCCVQEFLDRYQAVLSEQAKNIFGKM